MVERPWLKHYEPGLPHTLRPYPECTLLDVMSDTVRQRPGHTALIFKGTRVSYARLDQLTNAFGAALVAQGGQIMRANPRQHTLEDIYFELQDQQKDGQP
jgi:long-chain acyl-CoA synthetase